VTRLGEGATAGEGVDIVFGSLNSFGTGLRYGMDEGCRKAGAGRAGRVFGGGGRTGYVGRGWRIPVVLAR